MSRCWYVLFLDSVLTDGLKYFLNFVPHRHTHKHTLKDTRQHTQGTKETLTTALSTIWERVKCDNAQAHTAQ